MGLAEYAPYATAADQIKSDALQTVADFAIVAGALGALGGFWIFYQSGARIKVRADIDSRNVIRIMVSNLGRSKITVSMVFLGTPRRKRFKRWLRRLPDATFVTPAVPVNGPSLPTTLEPGDVQIWYAIWNVATVRAQKESRLTERRLVGHTVRDPVRSLIPSRSFVQSIVALNYRYLGVKIKEWPALPFLPPATPTAGDANGAKPEAGTAA